jgi:hypothetical protein
MQSYLITRDQANSAGGNKNVCNKLCESAHMCGTGIEEGVEICVTVITALHI